MLIDNIKLAVIGLGYVGLPLAVAFGKKRDVLGYDINQDRISELLNNFDATLEISAEELKLANGLTFTDQLKDLEGCNCYIITVPTPIDKNKLPDLNPLRHATNAIGSILKKGDIVIYESTVYPGATEEIAIPILESLSKLKFNIDFFLGYSPERINPGDKKHTINSVIKLTSGSTTEVAVLIDQLYSSIIDAGTYLVSSIQIAEAAKVIENTQRDVNIALINELSIIFNKLGIDSEEILKAAATKWNFLPFKPGLVGGHCIGVDPYYLTFKAQSMGYEPEIILAGRRLNDGMSKYVVDELVREMELKNIEIEYSKVLVMGVTFKENCPDLRNSKVIDIILELEKLNIQVDCIDPWISKSAQSVYEGINFINEASNSTYDAIILAVAHDHFLNMNIDEIRNFGKEKHLIYDLKYLFPETDSDIRL